MSEFQSPTHTSSKVAIEINCAIEGDLLELFLVFSVDEGKSWYQAPMSKTPNTYSISIPNIDVGAKILYLFKAIGPNGEEFVENNNGQFFSQIAGSDLIDQIVEPVEEVIDSRERISPSKQLPAIQLKPEKDHSSPSLPPEFSSPFCPWSSFPSAFSPLLISPGGMPLSGLPFMSNSCQIWPQWNSSISAVR